MKIEGHYFNALVSKKYSATMSLNDREIIIEVSGEKIIYSKHSASVQHRLGNTPQFITFEDDSRFETDDYSSVAKAFKKTFAGRIIQKLEADLKWIGVALIFVMVFSFGLYRYGLPLAAHNLAKVAPLWLIEAFEENSIKALETTSSFQKSNLDSETLALTNEEFDRAVKTSELKNFKLNIIDAKSVGPNAFALPAGSVYITDELVEALKHKPELLYAVFLHEIGHVELRHSLESLVKHTGVYLFLTVVMGVNDYSSLPLVFLTSSYSRQAELEADNFAGRILLKNNKDPLYLSEALKLIEKVRKDSKYASSIMRGISSHPTTSERIERLKSLSIEMGI